MEPQPALRTGLPCPTFPYPSAAFSGGFPSRHEVNLDAAHRGPRPSQDDTPAPGANQRQRSADPPRSRGSIGSSPRQSGSAPVDDPILAQSQLGQPGRPAPEGPRPRQP